MLRTAETPRVNTRNTAAQPQKKRPRTAFAVRGPHLRFVCETEANHRIEQNRTRGTLCIRTSRAHTQHRRETMPIAKASGSTLKHAKLRFAVLPHVVVQSLRDLDALGIWTYLQSKPDDWTVRETEVREHFDISKERYRKAMRTLRAAQLITDDWTKDQSGRITARTMVVHSFPATLENELQPNVRKTVHKENHNQGETDPLHIQEVITNTRPLKRGAAAHGAGYSKSASKTKLGSTRARSLVQDLTDRSWAE